jgi:predicted small lipoprotein YifL
MKNIVKLLLIAVFGVLAACGKSDKDVPADDLVAENTNQTFCTTRQWIFTMR